jgi:hypothetical protein
MSNSVTLTNSTVNSGVAMKLLSGLVAFRWETLVAQYPQPGRFTVAPGLFQGWKNPGFNIIFSIQLTNPASSTLITLPQFFSVLRSQSPTYLTITVGDNDTVFPSYATSSSGVTSIPIMFSDVNLPFNAGDSDRSDLITFSVNCFESPLT